MHSRCVVIGTALLFASCSTIKPSAAERARLTAASLQATKTGICNIHHIQMEKKRVPAKFEHLDLVRLLDSRFYYAMIRDFPHAEEFARFAFYDATLAAQKYRCFVCPKCKQAAQQWLVAHPHDEEARQILAVPGPNQALQPTPSRLVSFLLMIKLVPEIADYAVARRG